MNAWLRALIGLLVFSWTATAVAAVPLQLPIQGVLRDGGGVPVTEGDFAVLFRLWNAETGGEALWSEPWACLLPPSDCVFVDRGIFSVRLGSLSPLDPSVFVDSPGIWLGMAVEGEPELPRRPVLTTAYAFQAQTATDLACSGCVSPEALDFVPATVADIATAIEGLATSAEVDDKTAAAVQGLATSTEVDDKTAAAVAGLATSAEVDDKTAAAVAGLATSAEVDDKTAAAVAGLATSAEVDDKTAAAVDGLATSDEVDDKTAAAVDGLATSAEVDQKITAALGASPPPPIVQRTAADFSTGVLDEVEVGGTDDLPLIELATSPNSIDLGSGINGELTVLVGTHIDDGTLKQYTTVTIGPGATVTVVSTDDGTGGIIDWRVQGTVSVAASAAIDVSGAGHSGGGLVDHSAATGIDGASIDGPGNTDLQNNVGGGGAGQEGNGLGSGGGGGGYGTPGADGKTAGDSLGVGLGGQVYGDAELTVLYRGSGGGSGASDNNGSGSRILGPGGDGGGAIRIVATEINVEGSLRANGSQGTASQCVAGPCPGCDDGGSGGGSGGTIHLRAKSLSVPGTIEATGGASGNGHHDGTSASVTAVNYGGGAGGDGRIRLDAVDVLALGTVTPTAGFEGVLDAEDFAGGAAQGTYTSPILDGGEPSDWGTVGWETYGGPGLLVRVRTGALADLSDAVSFDTAPPVTRGQDLSSISSVTDGHQYVQYQVTLVNGGGEVGPSLSAVVINRE